MRIVRSPNFLEMDGILLGNGQKVSGCGDNIRRREECKLNKGICIILLINKFSCQTSTNLFKL